MSTAVSGYCGDKCLLKIHTERKELQLVCVRVHSCTSTKFSLAVAPPARRAARVKAG
eukprot:SAG31_NODE_46168_length_255_cov_1.314103_1_plen_56_part_01